jgi:Transposase IS66 family
MPDDRLALRHAESRPIWERIRDYLAGEAIANVMPKEVFGQTLTYLRNQFEHLLVYLDDDLMPIDNNETEQLMKQVALGRKNWMFIGSVAAGPTADRQGWLNRLQPHSSAPRTPWRWWGLTSAHAPSTRAPSTPARSQHPKTFRHRSGFGQPPGRRRPAPDSIA